MSATPGPWHVGVRTSHSKRDVYGEKGELAALADGCFTSLETAQANARLIAAAPDMLAALEALEPYLDAIVCYASTCAEHEPNRIAVNARAAIARAKGQA